MLNSQDTTSRHFCCNTCGSPVVIELINADDLAYVCQNTRCRRCVSVDTPEVLAIRELLDLATMPIRMAVQA